MSEAREGGSLRAVFIFNGRAFLPSFAPSSLNCILRRYETTHKKIVIFSRTISKILGCVNSSPRPEESRNLKLYLFTLIEGEQGLRGA